MFENYFTEGHNIFRKRRFFVTVMISIVMPVPFPAVF